MSPTAAIASAHHRRHKHAKSTPHLAMLAGVASLSPRLLLAPLLLRMLTVFSCSVRSSSSRPPMRPGPEHR